MAFDPSTARLAGTSQIGAGTHSPPNLGGTPSETRGPTVWNEGMEISNMDGIKKEGSGRDRPESGNQKDKWNGRREGKEKDKWNGGRMEGSERPGRW